MPKEVLNYSYDDKYNIVYQKPVYDEARQSIRETSSKEEKDSLDEQNRKMQSIGDCYWIIDKKSSCILGPMTKSEFETMCIKLKVAIVLLREREKEMTLSRDSGSL